MAQINLTFETILQLPLSKKAHNIFKIYFQVRELKEKETRQLSRKSKRYLEKLAVMCTSFMSENDGPYNEDIELENIVDLIDFFKKRIYAVFESGSDLNARQRIFKQPITHFKTLR